MTVSGLEVAYGNVVGLRRLDLAVEAGQVQLILGSNGAGKSSALGAIAGSVRKRAGTVHLDGTDISRQRAWRVAQRGMVLVPEGRQIIGPLTVEENLRLGGYANRTGTAARILDEVYELFPILGERKDQAGGLLSGGQQQMLAFGRALMADPKVILLDEPSMGLAPVMVDRVLEAVTGIAARGIGVVMVEQNASALDIADEVRVLEQGLVVLEGTPAELRDDPRVISAFLGAA
ncbi:ABC transporter ATP-binding protein [Nakamurella alba]|nr:ABC transporter ATP-binding protein [Nakamurella alba]